MSEVIGTIRQREARDVIEDVFRKRGIPKSVYSYRGNGWHFLVGSRIAFIQCKAGATFYSLKAAVEQAESACNDYDKTRQHRNQIDLEDAIAAKA